MGSSAYFTLTSLIFFCAGKVRRPFDVGAILFVRRHKRILLSRQLRSWPPPTVATHPSSPLFCRGDARQVFTLTLIVIAGNKFKGVRRKKREKKQTLPITDTPRRLVGATLFSCL